MKSWSPMQKHVQNHWGDVCLCLTLLVPVSIQGAEQGGDQANNDLSMDFLEFLSDEDENSEQIDSSLSEKNSKKKTENRMGMREGQQANDE